MSLPLSSLFGKKTPVLKRDTAPQKSPGYAKILEADPAKLKFAPTSQKA